MEKREYIALFKLFLELNNALDLYLIEMQEYNECREFHLNRVAYRSFISNAFGWSESPQGHVFWSKLDKKWRKVLKDVEDNQKSR